MIDWIHSACARGIHLRAVDYRVLLVHCVSLLAAQQSAWRTQALFARALSPRRRDGDLREGGTCETEIARAVSRGVCVARHLPLLYVVSSVSFFTTMNGIKVIPVH